MNEPTKSNSGKATGPQAPFVILEQRATFAEAKKIAGEQKGRLPTLQEIIRAIKNPQLMSKLRGDWYWISDEKIPDGYCRIDYEQAALVQKTKSEWDALPEEERAYVQPGAGALQVSIGEYWFGGRLFGGAGAGPTNGARVVVIKVEGPPAAAAPKK